MCCSHILAAKEALFPYTVLDANKFAILISYLSKEKAVAKRLSTNVMKQWGR